MIQFLTDNAVSIIFGLLTAFFSAITLRYKIREHKHRVEGIVDESKSVSLYLTREAMLQGLRSMYEASKSGDVLWGQCVGCGAYPPDVTEQVVKAASRGVIFRFIVSSSAVNKEDLKNFFGQLRAAEIRERADNRIRIQGLSNKEVVIAFRGIDYYTAIHVRDSNFVEFVRAYFEQRWESASPTS